MRRRSAQPSTGAVAQAVFMCKRRYSVDEPKNAKSFIDKELSRGRFLKTTGAVAGAALASTLYGPGRIFADGPMVYSKKKRYTIAIVPKGLDNPVFALANLGGQKRAKELGDVDFVFTANSTTDTAGDVTVLEGLVSRKVSAIGVSCNDPKARSEEHTSELQSPVH